MSNNRKNPAVAVASEIAASGRIEVVLPGGKRAAIRSIPASLIDEVTSRIKDPDVPTWRNESAEPPRDEPNPNDPAYIAALAEAQRQRGIAAVDAMCMMGIELIDPISKDEDWFARLMYMQSRNMIDLSGYDLDDPMDLEFVYKKFVAVDAGLLQRITQLSVNPEDIEQIARSFPGQ